MKTHTETESAKSGIGQGSTKLVKCLSLLGGDAHLKIVTTESLWAYHMNGPTLLYYSFYGSVDVSAVTFIESQAGTKISCGEI